MFPKAKVVRSSPNPGQTLAATGGTAQFPISSSRSAATAADMARELTQRLTALGRAHDLVRPIPGNEGKAALLGDLLAIRLAPYADMGAFSGRVRVAVPRMGVGEKAATTLALVLHELATNSLKYGALSSSTGTLDVSCVPPVANELVVVWTERGGPPVDMPSGSGGYGSKIVNQAMSTGLDGSLACDWARGRRCHASHKQRTARDLGTSRLDSCPLRSVNAKRMGSFLIVAWHHRRTFCILKVPIGLYTPS
jgi:two-component sensor histidine kinase